MLISCIVSLIHICIATGYKCVELDPMTDHDTFPNPQPDSCLPPQLSHQYIVYPPYNPTSGSIFSNEPSVVKFMNKVIQLVHRSDILRDVFDLSQSTPSNYSRFVYKYNYNRYKCSCYENAEGLAEFAARAIAPHFDVLTMPLMVRAVGNTAANYLFLEGVLTTEKAERLALIYSNTVKNIAKASLTKDPISKFQILADSYFNFTFSVDSKARITSPIATYLYGNEWFVATKNYKWINC